MPLPSARAPRPGGWRRWALAGLLLGLLGGGIYYLRHQRQLNRYVRRTWATLTTRYLTGRERTPLLAGYSVHGIDVSAYQGRIDWPEVARQRVRFAFIKASEGATLRDARFRRNWREARAAGIVSGAYHYFLPNRDGGQQAGLFIAHGAAAARRPAARARRGSPALSRCGRPCAAGCGPGSRPCRRTIACGPSCILIMRFTNATWPGISTITPSGWPTTRWSAPPCPPSRWIIWQHSDEAYVPGIRGPVDFNVFQGSYEALQALRVATSLPPKTARPDRSEKRRGRAARL
ncbi:MAG: GH25 family lysozyme [Hymenobacter sp.]